MAPYKLNLAAPVPKNHNFKNCDYCQCPKHSILSDVIGRVNGLYRDLLIKTAHSRCENGHNLTDKIRALIPLPGPRDAPLVMMMCLTAVLVSCQMIVMGTSAAIIMAGKIILGTVAAYTLTNLLLGTGNPYYRPPATASNDPAWS